MEKNKFLYVIVIIAIGLFFFSCDTSFTRKKLIGELSTLFDENKTEFDKIHNYFLSDSLSRRIATDNQDGKISVDDGKTTITVESISQLKDNQDVYQILSFMKKEKIWVISGNGKEGWITLAFEDNKFPCFNFWYRSDFDSNDKDVKEQIENIKNSSKKAWIYVLDEKGWYIKGVSCFS